MSDPNMDPKTVFGSTNQNNGTPLMGQVVEPVDLIPGCTACGKRWKNFEAVAGDDDVEGEFDWGDVYHIHFCEERRPGDTAF